MYENVHAGQERLYAQNVQFQAAQQTALHDLQAILHTAFDQCSDLMRDQHERLDGQTEQLRKWFVWHDFNTSRPPNERLPFERDPAPAPR